ncbi:Multidrug resistance regulator 1 [Pichia kudriavzevii]|uniref:Multidrug resistance regulator 1 n=1 Tax=Pichia kudriavzevii TaxID=4909 RepID=A0A1V2LSE8_PICKU|nr:Multidrug resistance regulator 1 [Pichia kudriavzevii]
MTRSEIQQLPVSALMAENDVKGGGKLQRGNDKEKNGGLDQPRSSENGTGDSNGKVKKPKGKRNRMPLSCSVCRKRKIKCNRARPHCDACVKGNTTDECVYHESKFTCLDPKNEFFEQYKLSPNDPVKKTDETLTADNSGMSEKLKHLGMVFNNSNDQKFFKIPNYENDRNHSQVTDSNYPEKLVLPPISSFSSSSPSTLNFNDNLSLSSKIIPTIRHPNQTTPMSSFNPYGSTAPLNTINSINHHNLNDSSLPYGSSPRSSVYFPPPISHNSTNGNNINISNNNTEIRTFFSGVSDIGTPIPSLMSDRIRGVRGNEFIMVSRRADLFSHLNISKDSIIDFHKNYIPMLYNHSRVKNIGPLSGISMVIKDPLTRPLKEEVSAFKKRAFDSILNGDEKIERENLKKHSGVEDIEKIDLNTKIGLCSTVQNISLFSDWALDDGIKVPSNVKDLIDFILEILPNKKIIWSLIDRFFDKMYPLFPYLDQSTFNSDVGKLIESNRENDLNLTEKVKTLKIQKKLDIAIAGILLVVLSFANDSLLVRVDVSKITRTPLEKYLLDHPLSKHTIAISKFCLNQFDLLKKCALPIFQLALLIKEYENSNALTDGGDPDSQICISMLIQMAIAIGLNRDPSKFDIRLSKGKVGNLWRKIWYGLLAIDSRRYILYGRSKCISSDLYDTELPFYDKESSNIDNHQLEKVVLEKIKLNFRFDEAMNEITDYVCSLKNKPNVRVLIEKTLNLERMIEESFESLKSILERKNEDSISQFSKIKDFAIVTQALGLLICIYHHLYLSSQSEKNFHAGRFFKKKEIFYWLYVLSNVECYTTNSQRCFGVGYDMIVSFLVLPIIHKGWVVYFSTYISITAYLIKAERYPVNTKRIEMLQNISKQMTDSSSWYLPCIKLLAKHNFYAWRIFKAHTFILKLIRMKNYFQKSVTQIYNIFENVSDQDLVLFYDLINYKNYKINNVETITFKTSKSIILHNIVGINRNSEHIDEKQNPLDSPFNFKSQMDKSIAEEIWNQPLEEDEYWKNVFLKKQSNIGQGVNLNGEIVGSEASGHSDLSLNDGSIRTPDLLSSNSPFSGYGGIPETDDFFFDQAIYEMFSQQQ